MMRLSDGVSAVPGSDRMRYVARVDVMLKLSAVRKIQKSVDAYVGDPCMTLVAFTPCLYMQAVHKDGTRQGLCDMPLMKTELVKPGVETMNVQRVDFNEMEMLFYSIRPNTPQQVRDLTLAMIKDWAQDTPTEEIPWRV